MYMLILTLAQTVLSVVVEMLLVCLHVMHSCKGFSCGLDPLRANTRCRQQTRSVTTSFMRVKREGNMSIVSGNVKKKKEANVRL